MSTIWKNDFADVTLLRGGADMGMDALHARSPAELLMEAEETDGEMCAETARESKARCLISIMRAVTWRHTELVELRDNVAILTLMKVTPDLVPVKEIWQGREGF